MNMMFPKPTKQKKRKKHKKSIMQPKGDHRCYLCMLLDGDFTYKPEQQKDQRSTIIYKDFMKKGRE